MGRHDDAVALPIFGKFTDIQSMTRNFITREYYKLYRYSNHTRRDRRDEDKNTDDVVIQAHVHSNMLDYNNIKINCG